METLLDMRGVCRRFGDRVAVTNATLTLTAGRSLCLVGRNGAGKSTLLALAAGVLAPDAGAVLVCGRPVADDPEARRPLGYMTDTPQVYEALTGRENLTFFGRLCGTPDLAARVAALLDQVGLSARADEPAGDYSAGMRRRLDLARACLGSPRLLLLDEPAISLDDDGREALARIVADVRREGGAVLLTAHHTDDAAGLADECLTIEAGRLADALSADPAHRPGGRT
jgi:ABC-2 type transport system ATP-binding protein